MPIDATATTNEQDLRHLDEQGQEPEKVEQWPLDPETHSHRGWVPQLEYEEQKHQRLLAQAQREHKHHMMLKEACDRMTRARDTATKRNAQQANDESSGDQLEAEWTHIQLLQMSDDPWAETWWGTFLNLKGTRDQDPEWKCWYSAHDKPLPPVIHSEQATKIGQKADQALLNTNIEEVLSIAKMTPLILGCRNNPSTVHET